MDKRFVVVLVAIAVLGAWTIRPQTAQQARQQAWDTFDMDKCRRKMLASFALDIDSVGYDANKACESVRKLEMMLGGH